MSLLDTLKNVRRQAAKTAAQILLPQPVRQAAQIARRVLPPAVQAVENIARSPATNNFVQKYVNNRPAPTISNLPSPLTSVTSPGGIRNRLLLDTMVKPSARAITSFGLTAADLIRNRPTSLPDTALTRNTFGRGYAGEGGGVTGLTPLLQNISRGRGDLGSLARTGQEKLGISPVLSAPLLGIGASLLDINPMPGPSDARRGAKTLVEAGTDTLKYIDELKAAREAARLKGVPNLIQKGKNIYREAKTALVDSASVIKDTLSKAEKAGGYELPAKLQIRNQLNKVYRADPIARSVIHDGLDKIIQEVPDLEQLGQYLIARHAPDVVKAGFETGRDAVRDSKLVQDLAPIYEPFAKQVTAYAEGLLNYARESGLVSSELVDQLKAKYPNYVPLGRVQDFLSEVRNIKTTAPGVASLSKQTLVQKLKGSERAIENPLGILIENTYKVIKQGETNKAAQLLSLYKDLPDNPFQIRKLAEDEAQTGLHTFSVLKNGVKEIYETTPEIAAAAHNFNQQQMTTFLRILAFPTRVFKMGTTGLNIPFALIRNPIKDTWSALSLSPSAFDTVLNPANSMRALFSVLKQDDLYWEAIRNGALSTSFDLSRTPGRSTLESIKASEGLFAKAKKASSLPQAAKEVLKSGVSKASYVITHPNQWIRIAEDLIGKSEEYSRVLQYQGIKNKALREGMSLENATTTAADAARTVTANFAEGGTWKNLMGALFPYVRSSIQGSRTLIRSLKERPLQSTAKITAGLYFPVASVTAWNMMTPDRREAYLDIQDYEKENNLIIIPPHPKKDAEGKWIVAKLPMPAGLGQLATPVRRIIEGAAGGNPARFADFAQGLIGAFSPVSIDTAPDRTLIQRAGKTIGNVTPQPILPSLEGLANQNFYTGIPMENSYEQKLPTAMRVRDNTSGTAREIAGIFKASPLKTEAFIKNTFGGLGSQALNASDTLQASLGLIPKDQIGGESILHNIKRSFSQATGGLADQKQALELQRLVQNQEGERAKLRREAEREFERMSKLPKDQAAAQFNELISSNPTLAKKISDVAEEKKLGITYSESLIKELDVTNGARAFYIKSQLDQLKTKDEKAVYWQNLVDKKIITESVAVQLSSLLQKDGAVSNQ